jgi:hypothetical protein
VLDARSWRWPHGTLAVVAVIYLASYLGLVSFGRVEQVLEALAGPPEATRAVFPAGTGRAEALFVVFAFLFLTPLAAMFGLLLPLLAGALVGTALHRAVRLPELAGSLLFWAALLAVAVARASDWWPWAGWFVHLLARALLIALERGS